MAAKMPSQEIELVEAAVAWLQTRLPADWTVARAARSQQLGAIPSGRRGLDATIEIASSNSATTLAVEAKQSLDPRGVDLLLGGLSRTLRTLAPQVPILVLAPWLSSRTRDLLAAEGINYLDLTGNARIKLDYPALFVQSSGADRDPSPLRRGKARVRGPKAARLVRLLVDVSPPYGVRDIAMATRLNAGYTSRLLDTLDEEALIRRSARGRVESVDFPALLRRWADSYDVLAAGRTETFISAAGAARALSRLNEVGTSTRFAVTGSFAAVRLAPIAAPALLTIYTADPPRIAAALELLPADEGANVALLKPFDDVVWARLVSEDGLRYAAPSQVAVDCLTGNGRMPAEGEALLDWMAKNENRWRLKSLDDAATATVTM